MLTRQRVLLDQSGTAKQTQEFLTIGTVIDTNDPQQMGRVRAVCPAWGDTFSIPAEDVPWCIYASPFGGQVGKGTRGPGMQDSQGGVAYGMWAIPKIGAQVLVACLDGDPMYRIWMGCVYDQLTPHTMPHGRWMSDSHPELEQSSNTATPHGPYTSREKFVEPYAGNVKRAFGNKTEPSFEWRTRAADYSVASVTVDELEYTVSKVPDDRNTTYGNWQSTQGYGTSRIDPTGLSTLTDKNYDSHVYSITTPGFHALSMDDRMENCRMRFRTSAGHQILLDDTNERIYIQTAKGNNWVELDDDGNVDVYSANKVSIRSAKEINLTSDETIRMHAAKGIHMYSGEDIRMHAKTDVHTRAEQNVRTHAVQGVYMQADADMHMKAAGLFLQASGEINAVSGADTKITASGNMHLMGLITNVTASGNMNLSAGGALIATGSSIQLNGPTADMAAEATEAEAAAEEKAKWTNKVPAHEPYARCMTKDDTSHTPEHSYDSPNVNRVERGRTIDRGTFWRR